MAKLSKESKRVTNALTYHTCKIAKLIEDITDNSVVQTTLAENVATAVKFRLGLATIPE